MFQVAPFYHLNQSDYDSSPTDPTVATTWHQRSNYAGAQADLPRRPRQAQQLLGGLYSFWQNENDLFGFLVNDGSAASQPNTTGIANAGLVEFYVSDHLRVNQWITLLGGMRFSIYRSGLNETATYPRIGATVEDPQAALGLPRLLRTLLPARAASDRLILRAQLRQQPARRRKYLHARSPPSATKNTSSAFRSHTKAGCSTSPTSKIA